MKARLSNGQVVELEKGCNCIHHTEPHWLNDSDIKDNWSYIKRWKQN